MVQYHERIVTGNFSYHEITADTFEEFVEAYASALDHIDQRKASAAPAKGGDAVSQAVGNLQNAGLVSGGQQPVGLGNTPPPANSLGEEAQQQVYGNQAAQSTNKYGDPVIGTDPVSGQEITYNSKGKFGPVVKADIFASAPKGWDANRYPSIDQAVQWLQGKREWNAKNGK